jgi:hypothetical protein
MSLTVYRAARRYQEKDGPITLRIIWTMIKFDVYRRWYCYLRP